MKRWLLWLVGGLVASGVVLAVLVAVGVISLPGSAEKTTQAPGAVRPAGAPATVRELFALQAGDDSRGAGVYASDQGVMLSSVELAAPSPDGEIIWVIDHPKPIQPNTRVRRFTRDGDLRATWTVAPGVTVFTPGYGGDLWASSADLKSGAQQLVRYDMNGKLLASYPLPEKVFARSISVAPEGDVWVLQEEFLLDPDNQDAIYSGILFPIVDKNGKLVPDPRPKSLQASFIGYDGRLYTLSGASKITDVNTLPTFNIKARDREGNVTDREAIKSTRPFAADSKGRVFAESAGQDEGVALGVSSVGDAASSVVRITVTGEGGRLAGEIMVPQRLSQPGTAPSAWPTADGRLISAVWDRGRMRILESTFDFEAQVPAADDPKRDPQARVIVAAPSPFSGDPYLAQDDFQRDLWQAVYSGLVSRDASLQPHPDLALEIPRQGSGVSADGKTITWTLKSGHYWHDGKPVTSQDVVATWRYLKGRVAHISAAEPFPGFRYIENVEADGDDVVVTLSQPFGPAPEAFFPYVLPAHVVADAVDEPNAGLTKKPIGSGPYRVARWAQDGSMQLVAHRKAEPRPEIDVIDVEFVDQKGSLRQFKSSDVPSVWSWVAPELMKQAKAVAGAELSTSATGRWFGLLFDSRDPRNASESVKEAIVSVYPLRDAIKFAPEAVASDTVGPFSSALEPLAYQRARGAEATPTALAVLKKQGWSINRDGELEKAGKPFRFNHARAFRRTNETNEVSQDTIRVFRDAISSLGFEDSYARGLQRYYQPADREPFLASTRYHIAAGVFPGFIDPAWGSMFDPADTPSWSEPFGRSVTYVKDGELTRLHEEARSSYDPAERARIGREIADHVSERDYAFFERPERRITAIRGVTGYEPGPFPAGEFWNIEQWRLEDAR